jgi:hypothetical protein
MMNLLRATVFAAVITLAACSNEPAPSTNSTATTSVDPFDQYATIIGPLEPALTKDQLRRKYDTAVKTFCPGGREQMVTLKKLGSNPPGLATDKAKLANEKAATALGALWEFGCGKGHDTELYTPLPTA